MREGSGSSSRGGGFDRGIAGDLLGAGVSRVTDSVPHVGDLRNAIAKLCGQDGLRSVLREVFE
jgi:hypothetical protein